jgi:hypothetical protein
MDDLLGILALESVRGGFIVIGEDLGTVGGRCARSWEMGILATACCGSRKFDGPFRLPQEYPPLAAVSTTTHDLPTLIVQGRDIEPAAPPDSGQAGYQHQWATRRDPSACTMPERAARGRSARARAGNAVRAGHRKSGRSDG